MKTSGQYGRVLAFVHAAAEVDGDLYRGVEGPILAAEEPFLTEVRSVGPGLGDHNVPAPGVEVGVGLLMFEGWTEAGREPDDDLYWRGEWRRLTHWEMCRVTFGHDPWLAP